MRTHARLSLVVLPVWLAVCAVNASAGLSPLFNPKTMMSTDQLERGMPAVGKSVFQGTTITEFHLQIIGVVSKMNNGDDLILARVLDGPVVERESGILAGMSGSPVYVDGKVIGAIAFAPAFAKEPIAMITPISAMLRAWEQKPAPETLADLGGPRGAAVEGRWVTQVAEVPAGTRRTFVDDHTLAIRPVATRLQCTGLTGRSLELLNEALKPWNVEAAPGPGALAKPVPAKLEPGAAFGVQLLSGDFDIAGIGTITYTEGDRILCLGHPMFGLGAVKFPMATAWIHDFIPSYYNSEKLGSTIATVGVMQQDTIFGGGGTVGPTAPTIPIHIRIKDAVSDIVRDFHCRAIQHDVLGPMVLAFAATTAVQAGYDSTAKGMVTSTFTMEGTKGARVRRSNTEYFEQSPLYAIGGGMMEAAFLFQSNLYAPQAVKSLDVEATITGTDDTAMIERVYAERTTVRAGEPVNVHVRLRPWGKPPVEEVLTLNLPEDLPATELTVVVAGGSMATDMRGMLGVLIPDFDSLQGMLDYYSAMEPGTRLIAMAGLPELGLAFGTTRLPRVPLSFGALIAADPPLHMAAGVSELSASREMPWVVYGGSVVTVTVEDRFGARPQVAPKPGEGGGTAPPAPPPSAGASTPPASPPGAPTPSEYSTARFRKALADTGHGQQLQAPQMPPASLWWAASGLRPDTAVRVRRAAGLPARPRETDPAGELAALGSPTLPVGDKPTAQPGASKPEEPAKEGEGETEEEEEEAKEEGIGRVLRQPSEWVQTTAEDFATGTGEGVACGSQGSLTPLPTWTTAARPTGAPLLAAVCAPDGTLYYSDTQGKIYRLRDGKTDTLCSTGEFAATALALRADGSLLAGCSPSGKLLTVTPAGQVKTLATLPATYIWALEAAGGDSFFAGTGPDGQIFRVQPDGKSTLVLRLTAAHVLALAHRGADLIAATAGPGAVYAIDGKGYAQALIGAGENDMTCLAVNQKGEIFAGSMEGKVYQLEETGKLTVPYDSSDTPVFALLSAAEGVYVGAAAEGKMVLLRGPEEALSLQLREQPTVYSKLVANSAGQAYALANVPPAILSANLKGPAQGQFFSSVLDAERQSAWGRITWQAEVAPGSSLEITCRSGNTANPNDGTWSAWSRPYQNGERVDVPAGQYLQYRATFKAGGGQTEVRRVAVTYLPLNRAPQLTFTAPDPAGAIKGAFTISWDATDEDDDALSTDLYYRAEGEAEWKTLKTAVTKTEYEWDTGKMKAGRYDLKAVITDRRSNPTGWLEGTVYLRRVLVDNDAPRLLATWTKGEGPTLVTGSAADTGSGLVSVAWKLASDEGEEATWTAALPDGNVFTAASVKFTIPKSQVPEDAEAVVVRAMDAAGNYTDITVQIEEAQPERA